MTKVKSGDVVQLKSGGPKMTVAHWTGQANLVLCQWFVGEKLREGKIAEDSLVKIEDSKTA